MFKIFFYINRYLADSYFNFVRGKEKKHFIGYLLFGFIKYLNINFSYKFSNTKLKNYSVFLKYHYSKDGNSYSELPLLKDKSAINQVKNKLESRLFLFKRIFKLFLDGDSFVEFGSGKGQNIFPLSDKYKNSLIYSFDISPDSIDFINECIRINDISNINCDLGDLKNLDFLSKFENECFDHIILVNVFSLIFDQNIKNSKDLRKEILHNLKRICKKSLIIVDSEAILNTGNSFLKIEQLNRAIYFDNILKYFSSLNMLDNVNIICKDSSYAVIYEKNINEN